MQRRRRELQPYTYRVSLRGVDQAGQPMELDLVVTPTRPPVPVGADTLDGKIICLGQHDTYSYFQTGMAMSGTLRWGGLVEQVSGFAFYERSLALYRDWELIDVLAATAADAGVVEDIRPLVAAGRRQEARKLLEAMDQSDCREVIDALIAVLSDQS